MTKPDVPPEVELLARERANARRARDWGEADRLRAELDRSGWTVVDEGLEYRLRPLRPPDLVEDGRTLYGSSASVPSRLDEAETAPATVVVVATDRTADVERVLAGLAHAAGGTQIVVVANAPSPDVREALATVDAAGFERGPGSAATARVGTEVVWTSARFGAAAAWNAAIRRAVGTLVVVLDGTAEPMADLVSPLVGVLADDDVAVAGSPGLVSSDMRRFQEIAEGDAVAVAASCLAFRRRDYIERGPLDEKFVAPELLDVWWSLTLRDEPDRVPRRAAALGLPLRHVEAARSAQPPGTARDAEGERSAKRNFYRLVKAFGTRRDLLLTTRASGAPGTGR